MMARRPVWQKRRVLLPVTFMLAFVLGANGNAGEQPPVAIETIGEREADLDRREAALEAREGDLDRREQALATREADLVRREAEVAARAAAPALAPVTAPSPAPPPAPAPVAAPSRAAPAPPPPEPSGGGCDPNYSPCVPIVAGDLDCADVGMQVRIVGSDPHELDGNDNDGLGCESYG